MVTGLYGALSVYYLSWLSRLDARKIWLRWGVWPSLLGIAIVARTKTMANSAMKLFWD